MKSKQHALPTFCIIGKTSFFFFFLACDDIGTQSSFFIIISALNNSLDSSTIGYYKIMISPLLTHIKIKKGKYTEEAPKSFASTFPMCAFSVKDQAGAYFRFCRPCALSQLFNSVLCHVKAAIGKTRKLGVVDVPLHNFVVHETGNPKHFACQESYSF